MRTGAAALLSVEDLHVSYGRLAAVKGVSVEVGKGEVVCLIGPNGAGKSTTLAAVAGGVAAQRGRISFNGADVTGKRPEDIARLGISLVPEGRHVFGTLTVKENLRIGTYMRADKGSVEADVARVLEYFPRLRERLHFPAGRLSGGEQQMLVIGRALLARPLLMMVDEPSLGLAPMIVDQVYDILLEMRAREGLTLLINEQSSHRVLKYADRIYVIRTGNIKLADRAAALRDGEAIKRAYFGFDEPGPAPVSATTEPAA
jgi:branched-chain amino acid transport system ATP-binding protein